MDKNAPRSTHYIYIIRINTPLLISATYVAEIDVTASGNVICESGKIFLLRNDLSHDSNFSTHTNMETFPTTEKNSNFYLHGFSRYLAPNMAHLTIILTFFFCFLFFFFPSEGYAFFGI